MVPTKHFIRSNMSLESPKSIESILEQYTHELKQLEIPSVLTLSEVRSPYISQLKLNRLKNDLPNLLINLNNFKNFKNYDKLKSTIVSLSNEIDEKLYITNYHLKKERKTQLGEVKEEPQLLQEPLLNEEEDLNELRQRLISDNSYSNYTTNDQQNDYHESIQDDLYKDLTSLASSLKSSALSLSNKIIDDTKVLSKTSDNLYQNESLMKVVGVNLNNYLLNKSSGKISIWFLIKVMIAIFLLFLIMILLIKILPKM